MRVRKLRVAVALSVVSCLVGWAALAPPSAPPVPTRQVLEPRACATHATLAHAADLLGEPPSGEVTRAYTAGDRPASDLAPVLAREQASIAALRQAADCELLGHFEAGSTMDLWRVAQLAIVDARLRMSRGDDAEALDELLDVWSVGLDLAQSGGLLEVNVGAAMTLAAADAALDLLAAPTVDAAALQAARQRVAGFRDRPADLQGAMARDVRALWRYLAHDPRAIAAYARWQWAWHVRVPALLGDPDALRIAELSGPARMLQDTARSRWEADARSEVVAVALDLRAGSAR